MTPEQRVVRAKCYIDEHFAVHGLTLAHISSEAFLSPFHFLRLFKRMYACTPREYLNECRVREAQRLLVATDRAVADICFEVGFESVPSFTTLFRRMRAATPAGYRNIMRNRNRDILREPRAYIPGCFLAHPMANAD